MFGQDTLLSSSCYNKNKSNQVVNAEAVMHCNADEYELIANLSGLTQCNMFVPHCSAGGKINAALTLE